MKRKYIVHHTTVNGEKYDKVYDTFEEAQLSEAMFGGRIEIKFINGQAD